MEAKTIIKTGAGVLAWGVGLIVGLMLVLGVIAVIGGVLFAPPYSASDQERVTQERLDYEMTQRLAACEKLKDKPVGMLSSREIARLEACAR